MCAGFLDQAIELPEAFRLVFVLRQVEQRGTKRRFYEWGTSGTNWTRPVARLERPRPPAQTRGVFDVVAGKVPIHQGRTVTATANSTAFRCELQPHRPHLDEWVP